MLPGRWTFQLVEEYDDGYYAAFKELESLARQTLVDGRRHVFEAEMKEEPVGPKAGRTTPQFQVRQAN